MSESQTELIQNMNVNISDDRDPYTCDNMKDIIRIQKDKNTKKFIRWDAFH